MEHDSVVNFVNAMKCVHSYFQSRWCNVYKNRTSLARTKLRHQDAIRGATGRQVLVVHLTAKLVSHGYSWQLIPSYDQQEAPLSLTGQRSRG